MRSLMALLKSGSPNARQLCEYTGEAGFTELRFSKGRGRAEGYVIDSMAELRRFLSYGDFRHFSSCRVKLTGQQTKRSASVVAEDNQLALVADNGMTICRVSTLVG